MEEEVGDPGGGEDCGGPIQGISFAQAAQVQSDARPLETDRLSLRVEFDLITPDVPQGIGQLLLRGDPSPTASKPPCLP